MCQLRCFRDGDNPRLLRREPAISQPEDADINEILFRPTKQEL
jgi:hypothetical protein